MIDIYIAIGGAVVSVIVAILSAIIASKQAMRSLKLDKRINVYERMLGTFSQIQENPMLAFENKYFCDCNALTPFVDVYASGSIREMYREYCAELEGILTAYQAEFLTEDKVEERESIAKDIPFAGELFEKEEDIYTLSALMNSSMLPDSISKRINQICSSIRKEMNLKGGDKNA